MTSAGWSNATTATAPHVAQIRYSAAVAFDDQRRSMPGMKPESSPNFSISRWRNSCSSDVEREREATTLQISELSKRRTPERAPYVVSVEAGGPIRGLARRPSPESHLLVERPNPVSHPYTRAYMS